MKPMVRLLIAGGALVATGTAYDALRPRTSVLEDLPSCALMGDNMGDVLVRTYGGNDPNGEYLKIDFPGLSRPYVECVKTSIESKVEGKYSARIVEERGIWLEFQKQ